MVHEKHLHDQIKQGVEERAYCKLCGNEVHPKYLKWYCCPSCNERLDNRWGYNQ